MLVDALAEAGHPRRAVLAVPAADLDDAVPDGIAAVCADGTVPGASERMQAFAAQGIPALGFAGAGDAAWPLRVAGDDALVASQLRLAPSPWVLLALLLRPLQGAFGVASASATVLRPASERGAAALEMLGQQTAAILNFRDPPVGIYPQRIAFNTIPVPGSDEASSLVAALWDGHGAAVQVQAWDVPVFVGLSMTVAVTLEQPFAQADVVALLGQLPGVVVHDGADDIPSPVTLMAAEGAMILHDIRVVGRQLQMAVVADNLGIGAAQPAARLLRRLVGHKF